MLVVEGGNWKFHTVSTPDIANEVLQDLRSRNAEEKVEVVSREDVVHRFDPGGMLMTGDKLFSFDLFNSTFQVLAQHLDHLRSAIERAESRGVKANYYKLHSQYWCACVTPEELQQLKAHVNDTEARSVGNAAWNEREERINMLAESSPHFARVGPSEAKETLQ